MEDPSAGPSLSRSPALVPAAALLLGVRLGLLVPALPGGSPWPSLLGLVLLGVALGRRPGTLVALAALGTVVGALAAGQEEGPWALGRPLPDRPVVALADVTGHWRRFDDSWSAPVRVVRIRQGAGGRQRVRSRPLEAWVRLGGEEEPPPPGVRLRVRGHLRRAPALGNLPPLPPSPWRLTCKSRRLVEVVRPPGPVEAVAGALRHRVEAALAEAHRMAAEVAVGPGNDRSKGPGEAPAAGGDRGLALVRALVLGDSSRVEPKVVRGLRRLGLAHVLAVSGLHVALVAGVAAAAGAGLGRQLRLALAVVAMAAYLLLVGPRPSLVRASVMGWLAVAALLSERPPQAANALAVAAGGLALLRPEIVLDLGFQLTVGATAGIVLVGPALLRGWDRGPGGDEPAGGAGGARGVAASGLGGAHRWLVRSLAASVGAQLGVLPWALPAFFLLTPWAPVANLVAVPWTALALAGCLLWTALACICPAAAAASMGGLDLLAAPFAWPVALAPRPWVAVPLALGPAAAVLLSWGLFVAVRRISVRRLVVLGAACALGLALSALAGVGALGPVHDERGGEVSAVVIDVGQGDAILLRDGRSAILVDGGGWRHGDLGGRVLLPVLARLGVRRLDAVVASHPDRDHCGGLVDLGGYLALGEVLTGPGVGSTSCGRALRALPGVRHRTLAAGDLLGVGRWRLRVLHPGADSAPAGDNDASLVIAAEAFGRCLLLTGDVEARGEREVMRRAGAELACDVLKVAHHGSRSSTGRRLLEAVRPRVAIVSVGERNPYGHPAPQVLQELRQRGVKTFRTDRDGMVRLVIAPGGSMRLELPAAPKGGGG